jgi:hypothetical protein
LRLLEAMGGIVPLKLFAERSRDARLPVLIAEGIVPLRLLAAKSSVTGDAELLNAGTVPLNWLLLAATSVR